MRMVLLAGLAASFATTGLAQTPGEFLGRDLRDRGAGIVATDRARDDFAVARERAAMGNEVGAAVAQERGLVERDRADRDVIAADRNRELYRLTR
ncbi:hypothetical protein [Methylobacterium oryzihabitans]|uniref:Phage infection protein n=1 Tax=Methylobacterium oryzihabitans TaxID=2499852 RepID=A0A3S2VA59_9HYPH|nr:hypothetical protein [Methylobacterium oryzihabitans]RVU18154.1 hypothetical protein EOE48_12275 [Methylobacterium oryzihabitans]